MLKEKLKMMNGVLENGNYQLGQFKFGELGKSEFIGGGKIRHMAVGFKVAFFYYQIGHGDFLHSFFSTVSYNLENGKWGSRFPTIMNELYQGTLDKDNVETAIEELKKIQLELQAFSPDKVVWDIDDLSNQPPWGKNISNDITNLSNYFVTSDGEDFITIFFNALEKAKKMQIDLTIENV